MASFEDQRYKQQQQQQQHADPQAAAVQDLLAKAHSPESARRIYATKIQHRTLHLRPSSPPPAVTNAREARRKARESTRKRGKPGPLSNRERRKLGLDDVPRRGHRYEIYEPLHQLWLGYMRETLGDDLYSGGPMAAAKLASAEFHGALTEVVRSRCPSRVGIKGIVVRDRKFVMEIVPRRGGLKVVPKEGTTFRFQVTPEQTTERGEPFAFEVLGDQLMVRSADRANKKYKTHFLPDL
ncbi:hypothetical protein CDD80_4403 [Ophiocordyceps camponoti-rufipedis]|uniref:Ribonuclease P protein subunit n=1 Tax=Ophiocordyceps camponoti-rufipedis TaxID=2004952 RepID=A0A2C5YYC3_9HYPO|nr:hypothetical protein CDD80_4403 [Ophiocordyceps camponoti-rufipedis]